MSSGRRIALLLAGLALVGVGIWWVSGSRETEEDRVQDAVLAAIRSAEKESIEGIGTAFSSRYVGMYGRSYRDLMRRVARDFEMISDVSISPKNWVIEIDGDAARVVMWFRFSLIVDQVSGYANVPMRRLPGTPPGEDDQAELLLQREDGEWRIVELRMEIPPH